MLLSVGYSNRLLCVELLGVELLCAIKGLCAKVRGVKLLGAGVCVSGAQREGWFLPRGKKGELRCRIERELAEFIL